jgi:lipid-A-disaccharide synthase
LNFDPKSSSFFNYWIARCVIRINQIGLCNIIAGENVAKELIQHAATPQAISTELLRLVSDDIYRQKRLNQLKTIHNVLGNKKNSTEVAQLAMQLIN